LDADDLWKPNKLQRQIDFWRRIMYRLLFLYDCIDEEGEALEKRVEAPLSLSYRQLFFVIMLGT
jgi:hypothetical protein